MTFTEKHRSFTLGGMQKLPETAKQDLVRELEKPPEAAANRMAGRMQPHIAVIEDLGRVVIKHYFRGGILRHIIRRTYLKTGKSRCRAEFETLTAVSRMGVNVPHPVAFASKSKGFFFYHAWLVTKEIPSGVTLAELSRSAPHRAEAVMPEVTAQINRLIKHRLLHVDLHPGNVLIDSDSHVYLIDFDRARSGIKSRSRLAAYYRKRWRRAVVKHQLPAFLYERFNGK